jgi:hypothetical protein
VEASGAWSVPIVICPHGTDWPSLQVISPRLKYAYFDCDVGGWKHSPGRTDVAGSPRGDVAEDPAVLRDRQRRRLGGSSAKNQSRGGATGAAAAASPSPTSSNVDVILSTT